MKKKATEEEPRKTTAGARATAPTRKATEKPARKAKAPGTKKSDPRKGKDDTKKSAADGSSKATAKSSAKKTAASKSTPETGTKSTTRTTTKAKRDKASSMSSSRKEKQPAKKTAKSAQTKTRSKHLSKLLELREKSRPAKKKEDEATRGTPETASKASAKAGAKTSAKTAAAKTAPKKKPRRRPKAPYKAAELRELRRMLEDERERLLRDLRHLDEIAESNRQTTHATFSSHQADAASDSSALESTYLARRYEEERFASVNEALHRLEKGTYGLCELCADEPANLCETCPYIPLGRLRAKPFARMCVQLRTIMEKKSKNPTY